MQKWQFFKRHDFLERPAESTDEIASVVFRIGSQRPMED